MLKVYKGKGSISSWCVLMKECPIVGVAFVGFSAKRLFLGRAAENGVVCITLLSSSLLLSWAPRRAPKLNPLSITAHSLDADKRPCLGRILGIRTAQYQDCCCEYNGLKREGIPCCTTATMTSALVRSGGVELLISWLKLDPKEVHSQHSWRFPEFCGYQDLCVWLKNKIQAGSDKSENG